MTDHPTAAEEVYELPASFGQERLWLLDRLGAGSAYYVMGAIRLDGELDEAALAGAVATVVSRHEALRTVFEFGLDGTLTQLVHPRLDVPLIRIDPPEPTTEAARQALAEHLGQRFDLLRGPLLRTALARIGKRSWLLGVSMHHIVSDGWSLGILLAELAECYRAKASGTAPRLPELTVQYGDFAAWQREAVAADEPRLAGYWRQCLAGAEPLDPPPASSAGSGTGTTRAGASVPIAVSRAARAAIERTGRAESATPFMVMLAAYVAVLARWTERDDIVVGTPVAGRERPELQGLIGFFVNTLPIRVRVDCRSSFRVLLGRVREACLGAYAHQEYPFERIVEAAGARRAGSQAPLVDAMIALQNFPAPRYDLPGLAGQAVNLGDAAPQFGLNLYLAEGPDGLTGQLVYARAAWDDAAAAPLAAAWNALLANAAERPDTPVGRLPFGIDAAVPGEPPVADGLLHNLIEEAAARYPDHVAMTSADGDSLTYRELDERADRWARRLRSHGAGPERVVAICMRRSIAQLTAVLGILKSGAAYLPLDPGQPAARITAILADAGCPVIVAEAATRELFGRDAATPVLLGTELPGTAPVRFPGASSRSLAYVIYTSGSTGTPKGAMNTHQAVANRVRWAQKAFRLAPGEAVLHKTPLSFDVSAWEWMWPLTAGARLVLASPDGHRDPRHISALVAEHSVTTCHFVPSMLNAFLAEPGAAARAAGLKRVLCSGEELPVAVARRFRELLPGTALYNTYGPAETAIEVSWHRVGLDDLGKLRLPIGRPIPGVRLHVLDRRGEPVPPEAPGELHVGGVAVGRGYLGDPALTADRFVPDPFAADGSRLYRTGDRVRAHLDGSLDFLGRYDHQVKLRGIRVEPGEVEAAIGRHPDVSQVVVVARGAAGADKRLVAYVGCPGREPSGDELRAHARSLLPPAMVPSAFVVLGRLPVTRNGKVDRAALPDDAGHDTGRPRVVPPRSPAEVILARIWADVLQVNDFGVQDNFYALGGNSLRAVNAFQRAEQEGLLLPLELMLGDHTIEQLALNLRGDGDALRKIGQLLRPSAARPNGREAPDDVR